ncbi:DUF362 domain-containing protein [Candidatus Poribacteria bacterium]|nr:DUF362 domain-containing protein [Candidatus Poribacteria bacterium]
MEDWKNGRKGRKGWNGDTPKDFMNRISRRKFLQNSAIGGLGFTAFSKFAMPIVFSSVMDADAAQGVISKVVYLHDDNLTSGIIPNETLLQISIVSCLKKLTGKSTISEAWQEILPNYKPDQVIGIKVNCINSSLPSHPQVVSALISSLVDFGVPENNIVIWDRTNGELSRCGYNLNTGDFGVRCWGTNSGGWGYDKSKPIKVAGQTRYLSKILTQLCDYLINVPVLKDHSAAGVTLSLKNHYGSVDNPGAMHGDNCDPFIAELNKAPDIKNKTKLIVLDALLGIYLGGPGGAPQFKPNILAMSYDTVALDWYGLQLINEERQNRGLGKVTEKARYIQTAAQMGLGTNDKSQIEFVSAQVTNSVEPTGKLIRTWGGMKR